MEKCKEDVWVDFRSCKCSRKAVQDGYCKQHHPDSVKARRDKADAAWKKKVENSPAIKLARALVRINELEQEFDLLSHYPRALKLMNNGVEFLVVKCSEPYAADVANLIREHERSKGTWTEVDECWMIANVPQLRPDGLSEELTAANGCWDCDREILTCEVICDECKKGQQK